MQEEFNKAKAANPKTDARNITKSPLHQPKMSDILPKVKHNNMSKSELLQVKFIVGGLHPYSTVEESGFKDMIIGNILEFNLSKM